MATKRKAHASADALPKATNSCPLPKGKLLLIGGHESKGDEQTKEEKEEAENRNFTSMAVLQRMVDETGSKGPILVIPTASEEPRDSANAYVKAFGRLDGPKVEILDIRTREEANSPKTIALLEKAGSLLFTGGDQLRLTALLGGTALQHCIQKRYAHDGLLIAGTSAGATAMSTPMIYQGKDDAGFLKGEIHITTGLELMHDVAVDTHFVARGRIVRMAQILATNPACVGLGIEEDTAVLVTNGRDLEIIGSGLVMVLDAKECSSTNIHEIAPNTPFTLRGLRLHMLSSGERFTLPIEPRMYA
ncbi:cyanophycinase [Hymenobacter sp. BT730]|uniref:cyanophycinase n=1 Tax=Hymenobacter sp. BT730 TaxID=3063332 RepID=UPI0026DF6854|nr:cyanophycinase [Hymenobacter sp. BT730]